jgi:potassium-transporting ATPase ATP-binding subunit
LTDASDKAGRGRGPAPLSGCLIAALIPISGAHIDFEFEIIAWLWFTVLFANFAEAIAEELGKAEACPSSTK